MSSALIKTNPLVKTDSGIWRLESGSKFEYTDGDAYEDFLKKFILSTRDRSSQSPEMIKKYAHWDWVLEYHLSSQRANILRSLDITGFETVLELGCGCGAITRYVGEQDIQVDAIEGAPRRAEIARLRCHDLENVHIINANFNELAYPEETYDAVLLIGVIEYAKKFLPTATDHRGAVIKILSLAASTLKPGGVIIIAIENRLGLKYWLGATEDHYGRPYTGLYGYPQLEGIRTYDLKEWGKILKDAGIGAYRFAYPFPDYKMPRVVLFDRFVESDTFAYSTLYGLSSRDYLKVWQTEAHEFLIWKSLHESGRLADFANSLLIVCSNTTQSLDGITPNDFVRFAAAAQKPAYRMITRKPVGRDCIIKEHIAVPSAGERQVNAQQGFEAPYFQGPLLSTIWMESITDTPHTDAFEKLLETYYAFIGKNINDKGKSRELSDLLPFNITVDQDGAYQVIDQEWSDMDDLSPELILFRALMWFSNTNYRLLQPLCEQKNINNVKAFIEYGFDILHLDPGNRLDAFIEIEEGVQARVIYQTGLNSVRRMVMEPFEFTAISSRPGGFTAKLYWEDVNGEFNEKNSIVVSAPAGKRRQVLIFNLFCGFRALRRLKLSPVNRPGFFKMFYIALKWIPLTEDQPEIIWELKSAEEIFESVLMEGMHFTSTDKEAMFLSTCDHPLMFFNFPDRTGADRLGGRFQLELEIDWPKSEDVRAAERLFDRINTANDLQISKLMQKLEAKTHIHFREIQNRDREIQNRDRFLSRAIKDRERMHAQEIKNKDRIHTLEIQEQRQQHAKDDALIADLSNQAHALQVQLLHTEESLNGILDSRLWKGLKPLMWIGRFFTKIAPTSSSESLQPNRSFEVIEKSGLFDVPYYYRQNPDLSQSVINPIVHYLESGANRGVNPHPLFDSAYYLDQNRDVADSGLNPLAHYIDMGAMEGRSPHPLFDTAYYLSQVPDIIGAGVNPLVHYLTYGVAEGKNPHPLFDTTHYLQQVPELSSSGIIPLMHYLDTDSQERKNPHPLFDSRYYLSQHPKGDAFRGDPLMDYLETGRITGINPHPLFDTAYYLAKNPDVAESDVNPLAHYISMGAVQGRSPHPLFDSAFYLGPSPELIETGVNPLVHYVTTGANEGKNPHPLFDTNYYIDQALELVSSDINPLVHYLDAGHLERKNPNPLFDNRYYLSQHPEGDAFSGNPLLDYLETGRTAGLNPHLLFNTTYYLDQYKDIAESGVNPLAHYIDIGAKEGRSPHPLFDAAYYLDQHPDGVEVGINPLTHFLTTDPIEGINPHPLFDTDYYLKQVPDLVSSGINPLMHYLDTDPLEGKNPHPLFDNRYYISQHSEGDGFSGNPLMDYLETGSATELNPHPLFNTWYYLDQNREVAESGANPLAHYLIHGAIEDKTPHPLFDPEYYGTQNPDVVESGINPLIDYITVGASEGKNPHPLFDTAYYLSQFPSNEKPELFPVIHYAEHGASKGKYPNRKVEALQNKPKISIIRVISEGAEDFSKVLRHHLYSVIHQIYGNWGLHLFTDFPMSDDVNDPKRKSLQRYTQKDPRMKVHFLEKPQGPAVGLNLVLSKADGEYVLFLYDDDQLTVDALHENVKLINASNGCDLIYSDEDKMDIRGHQIEGFFDMKQQQQSSYHVGHLALFKKSRLVEVSGLKDEHERLHDTDFLLRFLKGLNTDRIGYIPKRLYY